MDLIKFAKSLSVDLLLAGRYRKHYAYESLLSSLSRFCNVSSLSLKAVFSHGFLRDYEIHLDRTGCRRNTSSFYMSTLRSLYGQAVDAKLLPFTYGLFDGVFTGVESTEKRSATPEAIARILIADLSAVPRLEVCRDYLFLSLQLQGMPFIDLAHLRKSDVQGDVIYYCRRKTGTPVQVAILPEARVILNKYAGQVVGSSRLLPLVALEGKDGYRQYQSALHRQNRQLKELAAHLGIQENLTTYVARHTWATLAYHNGVDVGVVSQGMGHHTEEITRTYLASFSQARLVEANYIVLSAILRPILEGEVADVRPEVMAQVVQQAKEVAGYLSKSKNVNAERGLMSLNVGKGGKRQRGTAGRSPGRGR